MKGRKSQYGCLLLDIMSLIVTALGLVESMTMTSWTTLSVYCANAKSMASGYTWTPIRIS